jgi:putative ATPase
MKDLGYSDGYVYDHETDEGISGQNYFPDDMARQEFYRPAARGFEREIRKRLGYWSKLRDSESARKNGEEGSEQT